MKPRELVDACNQVLALQRELFEVQAKLEAALTERDTQGQWQEAFQVACDERDNALVLVDALCDHFGCSRGALLPTLLQIPSASVTPISADARSTEEPDVWAGKRPEDRPRTENAKLGYFIEEVGESLSALGKSMRKGFDGTDPTIPPERRVTNAAWLMSELVDLGERAVPILRHHVLDLEGNEQRLEYMAKFVGQKKCACGSYNSPVRTKCRECGAGLVGGGT